MWTNIRKLWKICIWFKSTKPGQKCQLSHIDHVWIISFATWIWSASPWASRLSHSYFCFQQTFKTIFFIICFTVSSVSFCMVLNLTWENRQSTSYHKNKHHVHLWIWDSASAHICLTGTNMTKPQLESRLITSADAEGVTSHISQRWLLYDHGFNLGVTLLQNTGRPPFPAHGWGLKKIKRYRLIIVLFP